MTTLDWIIVVLIALIALWGYAQGFLAGGLALLGFVGGGFAGSRLGPLALDQGSVSPYAPLFALTGAVVLGTLAASLLQAIGLTVRRRFSERIGVVDGLGGAALAAALGLAVAWLGGAVALQTPGARELREPIQRSLILGELNAVLPPSGTVLQALARFDPFPRIEGPNADVAPPDAAIARDPQVRAAGGAVVRVTGTACGLGVQGSGWVAGDGVVVTNAHVVAGQDDTAVQPRGEGDPVDAEAIWFDVRNDVALLRVPGTGAGGLALADDSVAGTEAAVLGFPENGDYDVRPARLGPTRQVISQDSYGRGPVQRSITSLRGLVRSGNSGGPVVDGDGRVVATIFAADTQEGGRPTGFGVPNAIVADALDRAAGPVDTGPCVR